MKILTFDLETTGLDFDSDEITQFACMACTDSADGSGYDISELQFFLPVTKETSDGAQSKNGYTKDMLNKESPFEDYTSGVQSAMNVVLNAVSNGAVICGMNVSFDITMLFNNYARIADKDDADKLRDVFKNKVNVYDIYVMDKLLRKNTYGNSRRLVDLADAYDTPSKPTHDAKYDVRATFEVMVKQCLQNGFMGSDKSMADACMTCKTNAIMQRDSLNGWLSKRPEHEPLMEGFPILEKLRVL